MQDKIKHHKITKTTLAVLLIVSGPLFIMLTNPDQLPLPLVIIPFLWLFVVLVFITRLALRKRTSANKRQAQLISLLIATVPVLLLVFQSIHQLSVRDVLLSVGIVVLAGIYMLRADFIK